MTESSPRNDVETRVLAAVYRRLLRLAAEAEARQEREKRSDDGMENKAEEETE